MSVKGCDHVVNFKSTQGVRTYQIIHSYFVVCSVPGSRSAKAHYCFCHTCGNSLRRLHSCLECVFFGCINHIEEHFTDKRHCLSVDVIYGNVLCLECGDYVYDSEFEELRKANERDAGQSVNRQLALQSCDTSFLEKEIMKFHWKKVNMTPQSELGLRGLLNLGSTCFMNCIVQALMHTPLLRDYFLAEMHNCKKPAGTCIACELSRLFQEFYKGARGPLALDHLLHLVWTNAKSMAGYAQKDAHEFFVETLDVLHRHCLGPSSPLEITHCNCIIDQIFTGGQQSDVVCLNCRGVSTTIEPISVISLELDSTITESTLTDCLERYTRAEHLCQEIFCSNCDSYQTSTKQLTVKTLPLVVSFHFKRCERGKKIDKKISSFISFPEMLNMSPFMSNTSGTDLATDNRYSLFAVVNHCGTAINAGHYIAYVRQQRNFWFECNDDVIRKSKLEEVLASEGYLLFYHKHVLEYE